jgi:hypothetical protein
MNNILFFFLFVSFGEFQQEYYANMWGHYGSKIVQVFLGPLSEVLGSTIDVF